MRRQDELREFLRSRRARVTPREVGLPARTGGRRVRGLRREELALAAGVSVDYYTRMEQGRVGNVSDQVLEAVAGVLRLGPEELRHLRELITDRHHAPPRPPARPRAALRMMLDMLGPAPALLMTGVLDILAINRLGAALLTDFEAMPRAERNEIRWIFLDPRARDVFPDWDEVAVEAAAWLRGALGRAGDDPRPQALVDELTERSAEFARHWAEHRVTYCTYGAKRIRHPEAGTMTLSWESFAPTADPDLYLVVYTAPTGSPSEERLLALAERARVA
ncbi:transcriptional regulator with XRE-family HTH domain [Nonomuraea thailandensis]|uniref:Transcriptional regulator with XRE-family HTH domain n=1 Tax=Nonomuraea thailandensis TaxID=1188745 RepID=A0A9X2GDP8_9ACTN|nr:helix-turn-helix transcriptional regulator [Nonomuraea thailandensis]MCP2355875.1 transcriptional regulator with XRE-family HTH domain [Nonomuraea thailandensis]